jgi:hypothetical protein
MRILVTAASIGLLFFSGCDDDGSEDSGEIVRYEIDAGEFNFDIGEPQDSVVPIPHTLLVVQTNGRASYEFADRSQIDFRLSEDDLSRLESDVNSIDFEEADAELSGETREGLPAFSVTHDGTTVDLGDEFTAINDGEGPEVARQMNDLLNELDSLIGHAPGVEAVTDEYLQALKRD